MKITTKEITLTAVFTAIMALCAQISIPLPFSPVPVTLSLFAAFLCSMLLGLKRGTLAQTVYVLLGLCGAPVFHGFTGGAAKVLGPTGGYIVAYIPMALVMGFSTEKLHVPMMISMLAGLFVCYLFGTVWLGVSGHMTASAAVKAGVLPFIPLDMAKIAAAVLIARPVKERLNDVFR